MSAEVLVLDGLVSITSLLHVLHKCFNVWAINGQDPRAENERSWRTGRVIPRSRDEVASIL